MTEPSESTGFRGPRKWATIAVVALVVLVVLFTVVFPWLESTLSSPTIG